jgi:hypothetical protein
VNALILIKHTMIYRQKTPRLLLALSAALVLSACGGGSSTDTPDANAPGAIQVQEPIVTTPTVKADAVALFAIDGRLKLTALGSLSYVAYPIALFNDGRALNDTTGLMYPGGLEAHRAKYPGEWTQWRRKGVDVEVLQSDGTWKLREAAASNNIVPLAPANVRLAGIYESLSVSSSLFMSIVSADKYTFTGAGGIANGAYVIGNTGPSSGTVGGVFSTTPDKRGAYTIDGYRMSINYDNGAKEEHVIVVNPSQPKYIFIDGAMYTLK